MTANALKAITLHQFWASAIATLREPGDDVGLKEYETRSWPTRYRGLLAIHAGKQWTKAQTDAYATLRHRFGLIRDLMPNPLPLGAVVCVCRLVNVFRTEDLLYQEDLQGEPLIDDLERALGDWRPGRFAWQLQVVRAPAEPIPAKGEQGLWTWHVPERFYKDEST